MKFIFYALALQNTKKYIKVIFKMLKIVLLLSLFQLSCVGLSGVKANAGRTLSSDSQEIVKASTDSIGIHTEEQVVGGDLDGNESLDEKIADIVDQVYISGKCIGPKDPNIQYSEGQDQYCGYVIVSGEKFNIRGRAWNCSSLFYKVEALETQTNENMECLQGNHNDSGVANISNRREHTELYDRKHCYEESKKGKYNESNYCNYKVWSVDFPRSKNLEDLCRNSEFSGQGQNVDLNIFVPSVESYCWF